MIWSLEEVEETHNFDSIPSDHAQAEWVMYYIFLTLVMYAIVFYH